MLLSLGIQVGAVHDVGEQQHLDEEGSRDGSDGCGCGRQGQQVQQEHAGVGGTNAVVDPHTVVVEAMHTRPADTSRRQGQNKACWRFIFNCSQAWLFLTLNYPSELVISVRRNSTQPAPWTGERSCDLGPQENKHSPVSTELVTEQL